MRSMTNFGFQGYDNVVSLGTNGKMSEAAAAMGLTNLDALDQFVETNLNNYQALLLNNDIPGRRPFRGNLHRLLH